MPMTMKDIVHFTAEIGAMFPSEDLRYYYNFRGKGLNPTRKLYDKATNARKKLQKTPTKNGDSVQSVTTTGAMVTSDDDITNKTWLIHNIEPWDEVCAKWKSTFHSRRSDILKKDINILKNWPLLKNSLGLVLIQSDAQAATILHCVSINDFNQQYESLKNRAIDQKCTVQPLMLVIGPDITNLECCYVLFDEILYNVPTFLKCLDILHKLYYVMNFKYSLQAKGFYEFLDYFLENGVASSANVIHLINYLNNTNK